MKKVSRSRAIIGSLSLNRSDDLPLHRQLYDHLRHAILRGDIPARMLLPPTRQLAREYEIGRNTVMIAYEQLVAEGYAQSHQGSGTRVCDLPPDRLLTIDEPGTNEPATHNLADTLSRRGQQLAETIRPIGNPNMRAFQPGQPDYDNFPKKLWSRLVNKHLLFPQRDGMTYSHPAGGPRLREAVANYLKAARGVACVPEQIIITSGAQAALDLSARLFIDHGDPVWIEEPGYLGARGALIAAGANLIPVPVDEQGLNPDAGLQHHDNPRLIYCCPSYQYPTGTTMTLERRLSLLDLARQKSSWILEDDYDSEFRYQDRPLAAMQGLTPDARVIYIGTLSKVMFPALRMGYLVAPRGTEDVFTNAIRHTGQTVPLAYQNALADFIEDGHFATHIRRMRELYKARRDMVINLCEQRLGNLVRVGGAAAGMQVPIYLPDDIPDTELSIAAIEFGITLTPMSPYALKRTDINGLLLGYAGTPEVDIERGIDVLTTLLSNWKS